MKNRIACGALTGGFSIAAGSIAYGLREVPILAIYAVIIVAVLGGVFSAISADDC